MSSLPLCGTVQLPPLDTRQLVDLALEVAKQGSRAGAWVVVALADQDDPLELDPHASRPTTLQQLPEEATVAGLRIEPLDDGLLARFDPAAGTAQQLVLTSPGVEPLERAIGASMDVLGRTKATVAYCGNALLRGPWPPYRLLRRLMEWFREPIGAGQCRLSVSVFSSGRGTPQQIPLNVTGRQPSRCPLCRISHPTDVCEQVRDLGRLEQVTGYHLQGPDGLDWRVEVASGRVTLADTVLDRFAAAHRRLGAILLRPAPPELVAASEGG